MVKVSRVLFVLVGILLILTPAHAGPFDDDFERAQSQADDGFGELDQEIPDPETAKPKQKVIIIEKEVIRERLVPVPIPVPVPTPPPAPVVRTPAPQAPVPMAPASERTVVSNGLRFNLMGCTLANRNIECGLTVVSTEDDRRLNLYDATSVFDNLGNQYHPRLLSLGNKERRGSLEMRLIRGITIRSKIFFENVSSQTNSISMLELKMYANGKPFTLQFRNITFGN